MFITVTMFHDWQTNAGIIFMKIENISQYLNFYAIYEMTRFIKK